MVQDMACRCMSRIFHDLFLVILCWFTRKLHWEERWKCGTLKCLVSSSKIWNMSILTRNWWAHGQATTISGGIQMSEALCVWNPYPENGIYHCILLPNKTSTKQMLGFDLENLNEFARRLETSRWPLQHSVGRPPARFETSDFVEIRQEFFHFTIQVSCEIFPAQQLCNSGWVCCAPESLFEGKTQGVRPNKQYDCFKKNTLKSTVCGAEPIWEISIGCRHHMISMRFKFGV